MLAGHGSWTEKSSSHLINNQTPEGSVQDQDSLLRIKVLLLVPMAIGSHGQVQTPLSDKS